MPNVSLNHRKPNFFSTSFFTFQLLVTFIETIKSQLLVPDSLTQRISALFCLIILCTKFSMHLSWSRLQFFASRPHNQPEIDLQKDRYLWVSWAAVLWGAQNQVRELPISSGSLTSNGERRCIGFLFSGEVWIGERRRPGRTTLTCWLLHGLTDHSTLALPVPVALSFTTSLASNPALRESKESRVDREECSERDERGPNFLHLMVEGRIDRNDKWPRYTPDGRMQIPQSLARSE